MQLYPHLPAAFSKPIPLPRGWFVLAAAVLAWLALVAVTVGAIALIQLAGN